MKTCQYLCWMACAQLAFAGVSSAGERFVLTTGKVIRRVPWEMRVVMQISTKAVPKEEAVSPALDAVRDAKIEEIRAFLKGTHGEGGWKILTSSTGVSVGPKGTSSIATITVVLDEGGYASGVLEYATGHEGVKVLWTSTGYSPDAGGYAHAEALGIARAKAKELVQFTESSLGEALEITESEIELGEEASAQERNGDREGDTPKRWITLGVKVRAKFALVDNASPPEGAR